MLNFQSKMNDLCSLVESQLEKYLNRSDKLKQVLFDAMNYSISAGGKRIRPIILLEFNRICGGKAEDALPFACALEMIHTYSLIHDDLPCMDDDDFRRGKPSCHKAFGEANALLAGDALLNLAFETMLSSCNNISSDRKIAAAATIAKCSGADGMIGGQIIDLTNEGKKIDYDTLIKLYRDKTGALLRAAAVCGAILGGGSEEQIKAAETYADNVGLAFQIVDDVLDTIGDEKILGKPIGSDDKNDKSTFVSFFGVEASLEKAKELTEGAIDALNAFDDTDFLVKLSKSLCNRNK